jgi:predicted transposase/invertase (TIGR01784 family)
MAKQTQPDEQDAPWKVMFRQYYREGMEFFFPIVAHEIDWARPVEFLDKEFGKIAPDAVTGKRFADMLVKVYLKRGTAIYLLVHLEIQGSRESRFAYRVFTYALRILDYFGQPATSLVVLCDADQNWRPQSYGFTLPGTTLNFEFSTVKLLDYRDRWDELEASQNPFAWVVMAHLKMQETRRDKPSRKIWKMRLIRRLHESGYNKTDILNVYRFIDWLLTLPKPLANEFWQELKTYEEDRKMPYITTGERIGYDRGKVEGKVEGQEEKAIAIALNMLNDNLPLETIARFTGLTISELEGFANAQLQQLQTQSE